MGPGWQASAKRQSPEHVTCEEVFFPDLQDVFLLTGAAQRIAIAAYAQGATVPFLLLWGKSPETQST